ncbi:MAG: hypothetical protein H6R18_349 [Proteobacteria bacterium]|nr:hypothetical protein [Pseudomonadota bacterium]
MPEIEPKLIVVWRITERCTLTCPFCANDASLGGLRREVVVEQVERFGCILGEFRQRTGRRVLLSWLGGEPLLWPPLFAVSRRLHDDFGLELSLTTNGTTLNLPEAQEELLASFSEITVSIDGFAPLHDQLRGWPGGWQQIREAVIALADRRTEKRLPKLRANIVLMRDNLPLFAELCETLAMWGIDEITFNQLGGRERPEFFPDHRLRPEDAKQLATMLPALRAKLAARGVRLCGSDDYLTRISASSHNQPLPIADCAPGQRYLFIDECGRMAPCSFTGAEFGIPIDDIASAADLLALPQRFAAMREQSLAAACADCPSTQVFAKFLN